MKKIRIIALILASLMLIVAFASCQTNTANNTTTTTTKSDTPVVPPEKSDDISIKIDFNGVSSVDDILVPDDFTIQKSGDISFKDDALKIGHQTGTNGIFNIRDEYLTINEDYEFVTLTTKWTVDKLPAAGRQISVVSAVYKGGPYTSVDAAGNEEKHEDGMYYQFLLKVDNDGGLYYYDPLRWARPVVSGGEQIKIEEGKTYELKCEYSLLEEDMLAYTVSLNGEYIANGSLMYVYREGDTEDFYFRFGDLNGSYKMTFDDIAIDVQAL